MRSKVLVAVLLVLVSGLQCGCFGNGPNPHKTLGDGVAGLLDSVTTVVLYVPGVVLLGIWLVEQELTALIRSDGGEGAPAEPECVEETPEPPPVEFPPPQDEPACGSGHGCG